MERRIPAECGDTLEITIPARKFLKLRPFGGGTTVPVRGPRAFVAYERVHPSGRVWIYVPELDLATLKEPDPEHPMADSLKQAWDDDDDEDERQRLAVKVQRQDEWEEYFK